VLDGNELQRLAERIAVARETAPNGKSAGARKVGKP
jgi:hypothetical protein